MIYTKEQTDTLINQTFAYVKVNIETNVLRIRLNRPQAKNAMSPTMVREYAYALSYAQHTPSIWAVIFEAEGNVWCAGADLKAMRGQEEANDSTIPMPEQPIVIGELFKQTHKPIIAKLHAPVYAGGHLLVAGCNYVIASKNVHFNLPEVKRGLFPFQVLDMLLSVLPPKKAINWCMLGGRLGVDEALSLGLVDELVESENDLENAIQAFLNTLFENSPSAIRLGLKAIDQLRQVSDTDKQAFLKQMLGETIKTKDAQEGLKAFAEKRKPIWTGE